MAKKSSPKRSEIAKKDDSLTNKKRVIGVSLVVLSIIIFLSIISYSRLDEAKLTNTVSDVIGFESQTENYEENHSLNNWLGVIGAYTSIFFVKSTLGIFSIVFPVLIFIWGISFFFDFDFHKKLKFSNLSLAFSLIAASVFGVLRLKFHIFFDTYELSGAIGDFIGEASGILLGGLGSLIFFIALTVTLCIVFFNLKIENFFITSKLLIDKTAEAGKDKLSSFKQSSIKDVPLKPKDNLDNDTKNVILPKENDNSPKSSFLDRILGEREYQNPESEFSKKEEPTIRIVRKDDSLLRKEVNTTNETKQNSDSLNITHNKSGKDFNSKNTTESKETQKNGEIATELNTIETLRSDVLNNENNTTKGVDRRVESELPEQWEEKIVFSKLSLDLLNEIPIEDYKVADEELKKNAELLKDKLLKFDIEIQDIKVTPGPVVTLYEIVPAPGVKISKIVGLENDIALALAAKGIRIIAPIPGKSAIGVEIPNSIPSLVVAKAIISKLDGNKAVLPLALGKDISGEIFITDLAKMPHLLIAGSTGSGKSVGINMIITSLLYAKHPSEVKFVIVDPKKIELNFYEKLKYHFLAVSPDLNEDIITSPQNAVLVLKSVEFEMEQRYDKLAKAGVRNIIDYNQKIADPAKKPKDTDEIKHHNLPYIIVIIDELADLMITSGKEVEEPIARLAQLARAVGIHLVLATQRPSVNVLTGVIKANFSSRIAYQVATKIDSRTILDQNGAQQLLGRGDMLFLPGGTPKPIRLQNAFITTDEVERITDEIQKQKGYSKPYYLPSLNEKKKGKDNNFADDLDPLFCDAARVVIMHQQGSVSLLQRRLKVGYSRAARIVDQLEEAGIVGPNDGSKAREVLIEDEETLETILRNL